MNLKNTTKVVKHKLISFATVIALFTLVTLLIKLIQILPKWKYIQNQNYAILIVVLRKRGYFCLKIIVPVTGLDRAYGKIIIPVSDI